VSLRVKLLLLWGGLAVAPLVTIGVWQYVHSMRTLRTLIASRVAAISERATEDLADRYARRLSDLMLVAGNAETQRLYETYSTGDGASLDQARSAAERYLYQAWELFGQSYHWIELRDSADVPLLRLGAGGTSDSAAAPWSARPSPSATTPLVQPVRRSGDGTQLGTVVALVPLDRLLPREALETTFGRTGYSVVIDRAAGQVIYHSGHAFPGRSVSTLLGRSGWNVDLEVLRQERGSFAYQESDSTRIASFTSMAVPPWTVISSATVDEFAPSVAGMRKVSLFLVLLVALVASTAFVLVVRRGTRSLIALTSAADQVGAGSFAPKLPQPSDDEVGRLTAAFGLMVGKLEEMVRQIETGRHMAVVGEFASQISHEIRNPLTSLKLNIQTLRRAAAAGRIPDDQRQAVETCLQEIHRLDRVVRGVLALGRPHEDSHVPCSVHEVLDAALDVIRPQAREKGVHVDAELGARADRVSGNAERLEAAFLNLLLNGLDAVVDGGRVLVTTENRPREGAPTRTIAVRIADDGPGVPPEVREQVFRPFYSSKPEGSGFGLPLAARTVEEHGGRLVLDEDAGPLRGATFTVELPILTASQER
jgi:signal transduction histidine kinase